MHVGVVRPEELEGVCTLHFLVVLNFDPRLGEVGENCQGGLVSETYVMFVKIDELLCLNVRHEHGDADLHSSFLDVVDRLDGIVVLRGAEEIFLTSLIGDIRVDICRFAQPLV